MTLYSLVALILWAFVLSLAGILRYSPLDIAGATVIAVATALGVNFAIARALKATTEVDSTIITALILALIVPLGLREHAIYIAAAAATAAASKYIVTVDKQHLFNPAALALVALALLCPNLTASWWVGTPAMLPAVIACGVTVMLKVRRTAVVLTFFAVYGAIVTASALGPSLSLMSVPDAWRLATVDTAVMFFALFMLTDPISIPSGRLASRAYAALVALLYATPELRFLPIGLVPEQALCAGNVFSFILRPKYRLNLRLKAKVRMGADAWAFRFELPQPLAFAPGQHMEWTVPHREADGRGRRRVFTIASSPSENDLSIVMRVPDPPSSYKRALVNAKEGSAVVAARLAGDFVLPRNLKQPLAFIAGGVGVAPFRSMAQYIVDRGVRCDIVLLYANRRADGVLFCETFDAASEWGMRTVYVLTDRQAAPHAWKGAFGRIDSQLINAEIPDCLERTFYVSGSLRMVRDMQSVLKRLHVPSSRIRTDRFEGSVDA